MTQDEQAVRRLHFALVEAQLALAAVLEALEPLVPLDSQANQPRFAAQPVQLDRLGMPARRAGKPAARTFSRLTLYITPQ